MARLTSKERDELPNSDFALSGRRYPVNNRNHAIAAKAMAERFATPDERAVIDRKADAVLGKKKNPLVAMLERQR